MRLNLLLALCLQARLGQEFRENEERTALKKDGEKKEGCWLAPPPFEGS